MISHTEAQELHELLGSLIESEQVFPFLPTASMKMLERARELAAVIVSDTDEDKKESIWIATIDTKFGTNVYAAKTEKGIHNELYEYVVEEWAFEAHQLPAGSPKDCPEDQNLALELYFDNVYGESYEVHELTLKG